MKILGVLMMCFVFASFSLFALFDIIWWVDGNDGKDFLVYLWHWVLIMLGGFLIINGGSK